MIIALILIIVGVIILCFTWLTGFGLIGFIPLIFGIIRMVKTIKGKK